MTGVDRRPSVDDVEATRSFNIRGTAVVDIGGPTQDEAGSMVDARGLCELANRYADRLLGAA